MDRYCKHCGQELQIGARFCTSCGRPTATPQRTTQDKGSRTPTAKEGLTWRFETVRAISGTQFELFVADLLTAMGHNTRRLGGSGDQGVDLIVEYFGERVAVQCKNYAKPVGNKPVQEVFAGAKHHGCQQAWVVAPAGFTSGAYALARSVGVKLFDAASIRSWISAVDKVALQHPRSEDSTPTYSVSELMSKQDGSESSDREAHQRHGAGRMSERRRPRRELDNPWIAWGCGVPTLGCLFVGLAFLLVLIVVFVADSPVFGGGLVIACIVVFGGLVGLASLARGSSK